MSRFATFGLIMIDTAASMMSIVQSSLTLFAVLILLVTSCLLAATTNVLRGLLNPTYFWDE